MKLLVLALLPVMSQAANYAAEKITVDGFAVIRLSDAETHMTVSIVPAIGNNAYDLRVNGKAVLFNPYKTLREFQAKPALLGVPFLAPWANRLDGEAFYANGQKYLLNAGLGNLRYDQSHQPIHGLVSFTSDWEVVETKADNTAAEVTSKLEFWRHPQWMAQFPFAHTIFMTHRLSKGVLEVHTRIENYSTEPMPVSVAFHPYYQLDDAPRDEWRVHLAATTHYTLSPKLIPTGETKRNELPDPLPLAGHTLDDVFGGVAHDQEFSVQGKNEKIAIRFGPKFTVAVVYAPPGRNFICFEPMSGITDAFNLQQSGAYHDLQSIPPGQTWEESFWIRPTGF
jgi:aldose 1-epimerase